MMMNQMMTRSRQMMNQMMTRSRQMMNQLMTRTRHAVFQVCTWCTQPQTGSTEKHEEGSRPPEEVHR